MKKVLKVFVAILGFVVTAATASAESVWAGNRELDWGSYISIPASEFRHISNGSAISFDLKKTRNDYQNFKVYAPTNHGWQELKDGYFTNASYNGAIVPNFNHKNSTVTYELTHENIENVKRYGILIHGYGAKVTDVSINTKMHHRPEPHFEKPQHHKPTVAHTEPPKPHEPPHKEPHHEPAHREPERHQEPHHDSHNHSNTTADSKGEVSTTVSITVGKNPSATWTTTVNK